MIIILRALFKENLLYYLLYYLLFICYNAPIINNARVIVARPLNKKLFNVIEDYKTGEYSINDLGKKYKMDKGYLSRYFRANGITNGKLPQPIISKRREEELKESNEYIMADKDSVVEANRIIINDYHTEASRAHNSQSSNDSPSDDRVETMEVAEVSNNALERYDYTDQQFENIQGISDEIIKLVKQRNAHFAKGFQTLSAMLIQKASETLQSDKVTSADINNIARTIQLLNDTLGVFPKLPNFAQQININQAKNKDKRLAGVKNFNLNVEFVENKKNDSE